MLIDVGSSGPRSASFFFLGVSYRSELNFGLAIKQALWMTYRCGFPRMRPYLHTDDTGWGCMLRSAQMLMANALLRHLALDAMPWHQIQQRVLQWFVDSTGVEAVYSIHNLTRCGQLYDILPGEWYGPGIAACILRDLCECHRHKLGGPAIKLVVTPAGKLLCIETILDKMTRYTLDHDHAAKTQPFTKPSNNGLNHDPLVKPQPQILSPAHEQCSPASVRRLAYDKRLELPWEAALVIFMPLRLGLEELETEYIPELLYAIRLRQSLGLIGGQPRRALFFPGMYQLNCTPHLVGFDPHTVQPALLTEDCSDLPVDSICCNAPTYVNPDGLDPSLALGFYCCGRDDFLSFCNEMRRLPRNGRKQMLLNITEAHGDAPETDLGTIDRPFSYPCHGEGTREDEWEVI